MFINRYDLCYFKHIYAKFYCWCAQIYEMKGKSMKSIILGAFILIASSTWFNGYYCNVKTPRTKEDFLILFAALIVGITLVGIGYILLSIHTDNTDTKKF